MARLPFIVEPKAKPVQFKIGNDDVGVFEIERRGYLSVAEKSFVDNFTQSSGTIRDIVKLSNSIALAFKLAREDAYRTLMSVLSGEVSSKTEKDIADKFQEEIAELTALMADTQAKRALAVATILLKSRVDPEWDLDDTLELEPAIIEQLAELYELEENKVKPIDAEESDQEIKEILGKSTEEKKIKK